MQTTASSIFRNAHGHAGQPLRQAEEKHGAKRTGHLLMHLVNTLNILFCNLN